MSDSTNPVDAANTPDDSPGSIPAPQFFQHSDAVAEPNGSISRLVRPVTMPSVLYTDNSGEIFSAEMTLGHNGEMIRQFVTFPGGEPHELTGQLRLPGSGGTSQVTPSAAGVYEYSQIVLHRVNAIAFPDVYLFRGTETEISFFVRPPGEHLDLRNQTFVGDLRREYVDDQESAVTVPVRGPLASEPADKIVLDFAAGLTSDLTLGTYDLLIFDVTSQDGAIAAPRLLMQAKIPVRDAF